MMYPHATKIENALQKAKHYWKETDWELVYHKNGIKTERKLFDICPIYCHRVEAIIDKSREKLVDEILNITEEKYKLYDKTIVYFKRHEIGPDWQLMTIRSNITWPLLPRETLGLQVKKTEQNTTWIISISVDDDRYPYDSNQVVRTKMHFVVSGFEKIENQTRYTKMVLMDPMGDIPTTIVNWYAGNLVNIVELLKTKTL